MAELPGWLLRDNENGFHLVNEWAQSPGARLAGTISFPGALSHKVLYPPLPGPLSSITRSPQRQSRCLGDGPRCVGWVFCLDRCLPTGKCWTSFGAQSGAKLMHQGLGTPGVFQPSYSLCVSLGSRTTPFPLYSRCLAAGAACSRGTATSMKKDWLVLGKSCLLDTM